VSGGKLIRYDWMYVIGSGCETIVSFRRSFSHFTGCYFDEFALLKGKFLFDCAHFRRYPFKANRAVEETATTVCRNQPGTA
jgi:hypothetical protein